MTAYNTLFLCSIQQVVSRAIQTSCMYTGKKQQQPKPVGDSFEVFQDRVQGKNTGGTRAKGTTAAGLPGAGLLRQTKPKAGI